jgi:hypothetical protein
LRFNAGSLRLAPLKVLVTSIDYEVFLWCDVYRCFEV